MPVRLSPFREEDSAEYSSWFDDATLHTHVGPMDHAWLEATLALESGATYCAFDGGTMVGVVGIVFPSEQFPFYVITELAVKPELRRGGIGRQILDALFARHRLQPGQHWETYVAVGNTDARAFFEKHGWRATGPANEAGMVTYVRVLQAK